MDGSKRDGKRRRKRRAKHWQLDPGIKEEKARKGHRRKLLDADLLAIEKDAMVDISCSIIM